MSSRKKSRKRKKGERTILSVLMVAVVGLFLCGSLAINIGSRIVGSILNDSADTDVDVINDRPVQDWAEDSAELTIAASPVMAPVLLELAARFDDQAPSTPDGQQMSVQIFVMSPEKMVKDALEKPLFQALSPDSSLWLDQLEQAWIAEQSVRDSVQNEEEGSEESTSQISIGQSRVSTQMRYAVSPIVIAAWESAAQELGWPDSTIGWKDIQQLAAANPDFKWNHASTNTASGLLATLAEFYAGAGLTRGLTEEAATRQETLDYVREVESTVRFYGEGEEVVVERLESEGRAFLDAFVAQERVVIDWNNDGPGGDGAERLVAIYPAEGTLWTDHPLALLELGSQADELAVTENQRLTYAAFSDYLLQPEAQNFLLQRGYRPADLSIALDADDSPFANTNAVDWREPQTTLQMPSPSVAEVVRNSWYYTKRPTNVYLVVDTSGSMEGAKINRTREALTAFVEQIRGDRDRLGIIEFGSGLKSFTPLRTMTDENRLDVQRQIDQMEAEGGTALLDAVYASVVDLQAQAASPEAADAINAIVVMTDGQENESEHWIRDLYDLNLGNQSTPLVIFTIGFGDDADDELLREIAGIGNGQFRRANETDIEELYRIISTYF